MQQLTFTTEMGVVVALLCFTVFLFVSEIVRIDLAAILVLVLLGILSYVPALSRLAGALLTGGDGTEVLAAEVVTALAPGRLRT